MEELVSIIIPVYNREKTIGRAIESVLNQDYKYFELLILDDGSNDNTISVIEKYIKLDDRLIFIKKKNTGVSDTRNVGIEKSKGKYIMFLDSDDEYVYNTISTMLNYYKNRSLVVSYYTDILIEGKCKHFENIVNIKNNNKFETIEILRENELFNTIWNKLYLREILIDNNIKFDTSVDFGEDFMFNILYCDKIEKILVIYEELYINYNSINGLARKKRKDRFKFIKINHIYAKEIYIKNKYPLEYQYEYFLKDIKHSISDLFYVYKSKKNIKKEIKKILNDCEVEYALKEKSNLKKYERLLKIKNVFIIYWMHYINYMLKRNRVF